MIDVIKIDLLHLLLIGIVIYLLMPKRAKKHEKINWIDL